MPCLLLGRGSDRILKVRIQGRSRAKSLWLSEGEDQGQCPSRVPSAPVMHDVQVPALKDYLKDWRGKAIQNV